MSSKDRDQLLAKADEVHQRGLYLFYNNRDLEALAAFEEDVKLLEFVYGTDDLQLVESLTFLGHTLEVVKRLVDAEAVWRRLLELMENRFGPDSSSVADRLDNLVENLIEQGKLCDALTLARRSRSIRVGMLDSDPGDLVQTLSNLGRVLMLRGDRRQGDKRSRDYEEAENLFRDSLALIGTRGLTRSAIRLLESYSELLQRLGLNHEAHVLSTRAAERRREAERRWKGAAKW